MASKYSSPIKNEDVQGCIHEVSDVKMGQLGRRYFHFKIQNHSEEFTRIACFHTTGSRDLLKDKKTSKAASRMLYLSPQKRKFGSGANEYAISKYSRVTDAKNLTFPWKSVSPKIILLESLESTNTGSFPEGELITVQAKVLSVSEVETVHSFQQNKDLRKSDLIIADESGSIHT